MLVRVIIRVARSTLYAGCGVYSWMREPGMRSGADQLIFVGTSTVGYIKFNVIKLFIINYHINDNLKIIKNKKLYILNIRTEFF